MSTCIGSGYLNPTASLSPVELGSGLSFLRALCFCVSALGCVCLCRRAGFSVGALSRGRSPVPVLLTAGASPAVEHGF